MNIKRRLYLHAVFSFVLVFFLFIILASLSIQMNQQIERSTLSSELVKKTIDLITLSNKYLVNHHIRSENQWNDQIHNILNTLDKNIDKPLFQDMIEPVELLNVYFKRLIVENLQKQYLIENSGSFIEIEKINRIENMLTEQINISSQDILKSSFKIESNAGKEIDKIQQINGMILLAFGIIIIIISTLNSASLISKITQPLVRLLEGVKLIGKGEYKILISNFHVGHKESQDEIFELTNAFKEMAIELDNTFRELHQEMMERKKAEEELEVAQQYIINIINSMPSVLIGINQAREVTQWNKKAEIITGISSEQAYGRNIFDIYPFASSDKEKISDSLKSREIIVEHKRLKEEKNSRFYENITIYPLVTNGSDGAVIRIDDITDKVLIEEMLVQNEKMHSVGGLAAGMAHEINNPLAGIIQTTGVISNRLIKNINMKANKDIAEELGLTLINIKKFMEKRGIPDLIDKINSSGLRVSSIINNMLNFARKSDGSYESVSIQNIVDKTIELATSDYDLKNKYDFKLIKIIKEYEDSLPEIYCEGAMIQQVLLNILRNGAQAMEGAQIKSPKFIIRIKNEILNQKHMIQIEIEDNGPGMDEQTLKRVFEPFFTTKPQGVGTGLGLSVSYFIIRESHKGELLVESTLGKGTKFIICLPINQN